MREVCAPAGAGLGKLQGLLGTGAPADNDPAARHEPSLAHQRRFSETYVSPSETTTPLKPAGAATGCARRLPVLAELGRVGRSGGSVRGGVAVDRARVWARAAGQRASRRDCLVVDRPDIERTHLLWPATASRRAATALGQPHVPAQRLCRAARKVPIATGIIRRRPAGAETQLTPPSVASPGRARIGQARGWMCNRDLLSATGRPPTRSLGIGGPLTAGKPGGRHRAACSGPARAAREGSTCLAELLHPAVPVGTVTVLDA
jgi:hypothetical protein